MPDAVLTIKTLHPGAGRYIKNSQRVARLIAARKPDVVLVMGSELRLLLTPEACKAYRWPMRLFGRSAATPESIVALAGDRPVVFFGAAPITGEEIDRHPNLHVLCQEVDDPDIIKVIQAGFPDSDLTFVLHPWRFPLDWFFLIKFHKAYRKLRASGDVSFALRFRPILAMGRRAVARISARQQRRRGATGRQQLVVGRMTLHMLAVEDDLMLEAACLSSYGEDVRHGAIISYDNRNQACGDKIVWDFLEPLLAGHVPLRRTEMVDGRTVCGAF